MHGVVPAFEHNTPAFMIATPQHICSPPGRNEQPPPPHCRQAPGQQAGMPCEPWMLPGGHLSVAAAKRGDVTAFSDPMQIAEQLKRHVTLSGLHCSPGGLSGATHTATSLQCMCPLKSSLSFWQAPFGQLDNIVNRSAGTTNSPTDPYTGTHGLLRRCDML